MREAVLVDGEVRAERRVHVERDATGAVADGRRGAQGELVLGSRAITADDHLS